MVGFGQKKRLEPAQKHARVADEQKMRDEPAPREEQHYFNRKQKLVHQKGGNNAEKQRKRDLNEKHCPCNLTKQMNNGQGIFLCNLSFCPLSALSSVLKSSTQTQTTKFFQL